MKLDSVEVQNFRKLKSARIDFNDQTTVLVGANNSGKTSAISALRTFFITPKDLALRDISICNWSLIDKIGQKWLEGKEPDQHWADILPQMDVWLDVPFSEIHRVVDILPTIDWAGGLLGVRLNFEIQESLMLKQRFIEARKKAKELEDACIDDPKPTVKPTHLTEFLDNSLSNFLKLVAYPLDPSKKNKTTPQVLPEGALEFDFDAFSNIIDVREISAQRELSDLSGGNGKGERFSIRGRRSLSDQMREYFDKHLDDSDTPSSEDAQAFSAVQLAEKAFDTKLKTGFSSALEELEDLGYPGIENPSIIFNTKFRGTEGLKHGSAIQYKIPSEFDDILDNKYLPEGLAGLGYQNLISMVFMLMSFRDHWLKAPAGDDLSKTAPLQIVIVEEPEAHLHAQVQQVFINKAYGLLRNHPRIKQSPKTLSSQLIVSTHSSHIAHEVPYSGLRYFKRVKETKSVCMPTTEIINMSDVFGEGTDTSRFVERYLKLTHADLFFADAVIFVEGQAERFLVPHFIKHHYPDLWKRYTSLIDVGGAHAHKFEPLIKALGLTSLVISDLDAAVKPEKGNARKTHPKTGNCQITTNPVLKTWHPQIDEIDGLMKVKVANQYINIEGYYELFVAYQKPVNDPRTNDQSSIIPRTFEDALIYKNWDLLKEQEKASSASNKINDILNADVKGEELESALFEVVNKMAKADFALDCLFNHPPNKLLPPEYISNGLGWLEKMLKEPETTKASSKKTTEGSA